ncbi:hypothetical protein H4R18_005425, partial [Coemansia javaensis]
MHLCDLPDNVLRLVLQAAVYRDRRNASLRLKSSLPLLAVCRRWRRLACASVYDTAYIKCYTRSSGGAYDSDPSEDDLKAEATKAEMTSNLDLIVTTGCVNTVKGVHIKVCNAKDIEFPRLKEFRDVCPLLESMVLPPRMDRVDISVSASALRRVSKMAPLAIKHFTLEIRSASEGDPATLTAINCILGSVHGARIFELEIKDRLLTVMPETLACTGLTHLGIAAPISLDAMLGFIRKLPNLASMGLWELVLDDIQADISVPAPEECHPMEPLDTRLKVVSINVNRSQPSWSMVTQATKYLLLRIPTLIALDAVHASYKPVMKFVDAYSKLYPHLANVKLLLNASDRSF